MLPCCVRHAICSAICSVRVRTSCKCAARLQANTGAADLIAQKVEELLEAGVTVVAAAGNYHEGALAPAAACNCNLRSCNCNPRKPPNVIPATHRGPIDQNTHMPRQTHFERMTR